MSVAVGEELPCQREGANSEDLFTVEWWQASYRRSWKFLQFAPWFYDKFSVDLLDLWLKHTVLGFLSLIARNFWRKKFSREQIFASGCLIA